MDYSFIVVNYNMAELVVDLVENIASQLNGDIRYEIIIVDNSTDPSSTLAQDRFRKQIPVQLVRLAENKGFVDALNRALPLAIGQWVTVMHPDITFCNGSITALSNFLAANPRAGVISPDIYYPNGDPTKLRLRRPTVASECRRLGNIFSHIFLRRKLFAEVAQWDHRDSVEANMVMSVCMMFRREALAAIGRIEPQLLIYYSNDWMCHRLAKAGWSCHYTSTARVIHYERFTPQEKYSSSGNMEYKRSTIAANPQMRSDYFVYLRAMYSRLEMVLLRTVALIEDSLQLLSQLKNRNAPARSAAIKKMMQSIWVDLGIRYQRS